MVGSGMGMVGSGMGMVGSGRGMVGSGRGMGNGIAYDILEMEYKSRKP